MPDTLPRPEAACPSFPVKRLPLAHDKHNVDTPPSPTWPGSITATPNGVPLTQSNVQDRTYLAKRALTWGEHSPLLSERESIFATHYTPVENDTSTPHLPPLASAVAKRSASEPLEPDMEFSLPPLLPSPSRLSIRSSLTAARSGPGGITGSLKQYGLNDSEKLADRQMQAHKSVTHGMRRVVSDSHPWARNFHVNGGHSKQLNGTDQSQATLDETATMEHDTALTEAIVVQRKEEQAYGYGQGVPRQSAMSQAIRPTRSERSVSRGRSHVDKSIEATLTNAEPGQNIRSRKSSHLMGVFRENTSPVEPRQREVNVSHAEEGGHVQTIAMPSMRSGRTSSPSTSAATTAASQAKPEPLSQESVLREQYPSFASTPSPNFDNELTSSRFFPTTMVTQSSLAQPKSPSKHEHDPYFRKQDAIKQSKSSNVPPIPPNLLEQIREYHNLVPMRGQGAHLPKDSTGFRSHEDTDLADRRQLRTGDIGGHPDENEEHISSAVYFPHPVPVEDLEQFSSPVGGHLMPHDQAEAGASVSKGVQNHHDVKRTSLELAPPEHIDISVQSKHEKRVFHGDYQPPDEAQYEEIGRDSLPTIKERLADSYATASDSEVESNEDIGAASQTEDGGITPTPPPVPTSRLGREKRPSISTGPRGAVLLEPYSHQVGGHSTIFRFSRRAVCKQLNNRENEFYERIERRHPEMLHFLPRYIGVLNVTFSKGPKPSTDTTVEPHKILEDSKVESPKDLREITTRDKNLDKSVKKRNSPRLAANEQRIVSQSQQIGERPQVILEQNRHIVPFSLFDSARRSRIIDLQQSNDRGLHKSEDLGKVESNPPQVVPLSLEDSSSDRHVVPSPPSWGKTSVNSKFGEQILLSVFAPPAIQHHKKHAKGHATLPRAKEPSIRRTGHRSADPIRQSQHPESIPTDRKGRAAQAELVDRPHAGDVSYGKSSDSLATAPHQDAYSTSASAFEDLGLGLERIRSTSSVGVEGSLVRRSSNKIRRRHSGMGLRRRGSSVYDKSRGDLEYYEEEGYGGDGEEEALQMESAGDRFRLMSDRPPIPVPQDIKSATGPTAGGTAVREVHAQSDMESSLHGISTNRSRQQPSPVQRSSPTHLPLNPKEAQLAKPDQRVVLFLLLEDLTADMGRPCVLDLKMGTRQYGIEARPKKVESQRRKCKTTTSQQLGVRICGMQTFNVKKQQPAYEDKYFGRDLKAGREFRDALTRFLYDGVSYSSVTKRIPTILDKISKLESMVRRLPGYRFYASSLLMLYDAEPEKSQRAKEKVTKVKGNNEKKDEEKDRDKGKDKKWPPPIELKIVDFANCVTGEDPLPADASCPPLHPGTVDRGYLRGLRTLKMYFQRILRDITDSEFLEREDSEATGVDMLGAAGTHGGSETVMEENDGEVSI